jgi:LppP/LprE lipoprotein
MLTTAVLALGTAGGALLGGCGGSTKTVTAAESPPASTLATTAATTTTAHTTSTATSTATAPATTTGTGGQSAGQQTSTTRTAPGPAFTRQGTGSGEATGEAAAAAVAVVKAHGYTPNNTSDYHPNQTLRVLIGTHTRSGDGYGQLAFFFVDGSYIGTDASQPSATLRVVSQSDTEVTLAYPLYRPSDPLCCPGGGQTTVRFALNNGRLVPLGKIPPVSSQTGTSRQ